jgi:hypothetical protein
MDRSKDQAIKLIIFYGLLNNSCLFQHLTFSCPVAEGGDGTQNFSWPWCR